MKIEINRIRIPRFIGRLFVIYPTRKNWVIVEIPRDKGFKGRKYYFKI
jgi:hypothetical protein